jgi:hypothetical protein
MPLSFVGAVEQFHIVAAAPILRQLVDDPEWDWYAREQALKVAEVLSPDVDFLRSPRMNQAQRLPVERSRDSLA